MTVEQVRAAQLTINEMNKEGNFNFPIHLALGHEQLAVSLCDIMQETDSLVLPHRNLAYNLAKSDLKTVLNNFKKFGSMNLVNPEKGILYTSSILGNNFSVACGIAKTRGKTWVVAGDGAIEEGSFYESLVLAKYLKLPIVFLIENNGWSLATKIEERRCNIDLWSLCNSVGILYLESDISNAKRLKEILEIAEEKTEPVVVEVTLVTEGGYEKDGRFINYHAGILK